MDMQKQMASFKLMKSLGIISQLTTAWAARALEPLGLNYSQYSLLVHFSNHPEREQTISQLAEVMQMNQPGLTKVVNKLHEMELVRIRKDEQDGRKKWIAINQQGLEKVAEANESFGPYMAQCFEAWDQAELEQMASSADKLMKWLDSHRDI